MNKLKFLLILPLISLIAIPTVLGSTAPIVYVATDGSGDYNCDGINDHTEINQALEYVANHPDFTTVYLKSGTYTISDTIFIGSDTTLEGNSDSIVKIVDNARWPINKAAIAGNDASNVIIQGFEIDGNYANNNEHGTGALYYNLISLSDVHNVKINNMYLHDNANDLIKIEGSSDIYVFNNVARYQGHEFVYANYVNNLHVYDNSVLVRVNSAIRTYNTNHIKIYGNEIYGDIGGYVGIYIIKAGSGVVNDVEIYDNEIYNTLYSGILLWGYGSYSDLNSASNVHIHHNIIRGSGTSYKGTSQGGISIQYFHNTVIENNVIDNIRGDGIAIREVTIPRDTPSASGFKTIVRNNIITNSYPHPAISGSGYGIRNYLSSTNSVIAENNCVYGNVGTYTGGSITYSNNIETDPLFVDAANYDYHLKQDSPIIGAGMGVYESGDSTPPTPSNTAPVLSSIGDKTATEGSTLSFVTTASDADGDSLTYSASGLPTGATFDAASRTFSWTPGIGQEGTYGVTFEVTDGEFTDSESVSIIVNPDYTPSTPPTPSNTAPVLSTIGDKTVTEGSALSFVTIASDADGDSLTYSASGLPTGATFDAASRTFSWTPGIGQEGTYGVTFEVTDGEFTDSESVSIIVNPEGSSGIVVESMYVNRLRESTPDITIAGDGYVDVGNIAGTGSYRDVMWFDLSNYEEADTITSATLSLSWYYPQNAPRNQDTVVEVYRVADFDPAQVSWNNKASGTPWNNVGGDWFDRDDVAQGSAPYASITFSGSDVPNNGIYEFDVTELVQDYVSGAHANTGFFIKARNENDNYIAFYGADFVSTNQQPKLTVTDSTQIVSNLGSWDVNRDAVVNILDVTVVAQNLGTGNPQPSWDVNQDGEVNIQDLTIVAQHFGEISQ